MSVPHRIVLAACLLGVAGCSPIVAGEPALSTAAITARDGETAGLPLTPGELVLRREARQLLVPRPLLPATAEADAYAEALLGESLESAPARYDRIIRDIAAAGSRIDTFVASADAVLAADRARDEAGDADLSASLAKTIRANENKRLVRRVRMRLAERLDVYRQALAQLVLAEPGPQAIAAEEAITDLEWRLRRLRAG